jgi:hypothetical protein
MPLYDQIHVPEHSAACAATLDHDCTGMLTRSHKPESYERDLTSQKATNSVRLPLQLPSGATTWLSTRSACASNKILRSLFLLCNSKHAPELG